MPWKETHVEEQRKKFIAARLDRKTNWPMTELCATFGISRKTAYKWLARHEQFGIRGLGDQSRAPKRQPNATDAALVERVIEMRKLHRFWGPRKILLYLSRRAPDRSWPAASTVGEILKRHGLVRARRRRRRPDRSRVALLSKPRKPNDLWSVDFKGWFRTGDGQRCDPLTISDGFSRFLVRCQALERPVGELVRPVFRSAFEEYGLPRAIRSDNGAPFASTGLGGLSRLSVWWIKLGIGLERIEPGKPQQNGRHERMHRTLKQETARPPRASRRAQQRAFDLFWHTYNFERPHEALRNRAPAELYEASGRPYPQREPEMEYPGHFEVRGVKYNGHMKWRNHLLYVSKALRKEHVGLEQVTDRHWRLYFGSVLLGVLDDHTGKVLERRLYARTVEKQA